MKVELEFSNQVDLNLFIKSVQFAHEYFRDYAFLNGGEGYDNINACKVAELQLLKQWEELTGETVEWNESK